jgi:general secretion pathway protein N
MTWLRNALLVLALFVGAYFAWPLMLRLLVPEENREEAEIQAALTGNLPSPEQARLPPLENFSEIFERPIFSPDRRPGSTAEIVVETPRGDIDLLLSGVIISDTSRVAILLPADGSEQLRFRKGDQYKGWSLEEIRPQEVLFIRDGEERKLALDYERAVPEPAKKPKRERRSRVQQTEEPVENQ